MAYDYRFAQAQDEALNRRTVMDDRLFRVVYQHFEEGLFQKTLSMDQATRLAHLIMAHVPKMLQKPVTLNVDPKALPEPAKVLDGEYVE